MTNGSGGQSLTRPAEIEEDLEHEVVFRQDIGGESLYPMAFSDLGQISEQCRANAVQMFPTSDDDRDFSDGRVVGDRVVGHANESVPVECAQSAPPSHRLNHLADELIEPNRAEREEPQVSIVIAEVLMKCRNGFRVIGVETTQRDEPPI
jgi:hypothetical protein